MAEAVGLNSVNEAAKLLAEQGTDRVFTALWLILLIALLSMGLWYLRRILSGHYVKADKIPEWMTKNAPHLLKQTSDQLPSLQNHEVFAYWNQTLRDADSLRVGGHGAVGSNDEQRTNLARDMVQWTVRGFRNTFTALLKEAYENKTGFEAYFGDQKNFQNLIQNLYSDLQVGIRSHLVDTLELPSEVYDRWIQSQSKQQDVLRDMFQIAAGNHDTNYWRLSAVLGHFYMHSRFLTNDIVNCLLEIPNVEFEQMQYIRRAESTLGMNAFKPKQDANPAARIFESSYKAKR